MMHLKAFSLPCRQITLDQQRINVDMLIHCLFYVYSMVSAGWVVGVKHHHRINGSMHVLDVLAWSVIERLMVYVSCLPFALTVLTIHLLTASHQLAPASASVWFNKERAMCFHICMILHVKDPM